MSVPQNKGLGIFTEMGLAEDVGSTEAVLESFHVGLVRAGFTEEAIGQVPRRMDLGRFLGGRK